MTFNAVTPDVYRGVRLPGRRRPRQTCSSSRPSSRSSTAASRDIDATRRLNPGLKTFKQWLAANKDGSPFPMSSGACADRRGHELGSWRARSRDRQLRLVHLQPRPVPGRAGGASSRWCATTARPSTRCSRPRPTASSCRRARALPNEAGITLEVVRRFPEAGIPTLGVCLGHQALAQAFGGSVVRHLPVHGKTGRDRARRAARSIRGSVVAADGRALPLADRRRRASGLPRGERRAATACVIGGSATASCPAEGVQFHPESVLTDEGMALLARLSWAAKARARQPNGLRDRGARRGRRRAAT